MPLSVHPPLNRPLSPLASLVFSRPQEDGHDLARVAGVQLLDGLNKLMRRRRCEWRLLLPLTYGEGPHLSLGGLVLVQTRQAGGDWSRRATEIGGYFSSPLVRDFRAALPVGERGWVIEQMNKNSDRPGMLRLDPVSIEASKRALVGEETWRLWEASQMKQNLAPALAAASRFRL